MSTMRITAPGWLLATVVAAVGTGCLVPAANTCSDGRVCAGNRRCDVEWHRCVSPEEELACVGLGEGDKCGLAGPTFETPGVCEHGACTPLVCGDGVRTGTEECDGADLGTPAATCDSVGYYGETTGLACKTNCTFDTTGCVGKCGDGAISGPEVCDGANLAGANCKVAGFYEAAGLTCSSSCTFDVSACSGFCGDGMVNGPERCEGAPPTEQSCLDYGYDRGLLGCSSLCAPSFEGCSTFGWKAIPLPKTTTVPALETQLLLGVWGTSAKDVFAVGGDTILHWNGTKLTSLGSEAIRPTSLVAVGGSASDDVFFVGERADAVDPFEKLMGLVVHWDGVRLTKTNVPTNVSVIGHTGLLGVWSAGKNDAFAVGKGGTLLRWNGTAWSPRASGTKQDLFALWGNRPDNVFAVGWSVGADSEPPPSDGTKEVPKGTGVVLRWNGTSWSNLRAPDGFHEAVWGDGTNDVFVGGHLGSMAHWDGAAWTLMSTGTTDNFSGIWGRSRDDVFATSAQGSIFHWDGARWRTLQGPGSTFGVWGSGDDVFLAGSQDRLLRSRGAQGTTSWNTQSEAAGLPSLFAIAQVGPDDLFAVGEQGTIIRWNGSSWVAMASNLTGDITDVWGSGADFVLAVDSADKFDETLQVWNGRSWAPVEEGPVGQQEICLWGSGPTDANALGRDGVWHWDGEKWSRRPTVSGDIFSAWSSGPDDAFLVGSNGDTDGGGGIFHWNGQSWARMTTPWTRTLHGVWGSGPGDVFAVGERGTILRWDGAVWSEMESGTTKDLRAVHGSGAGDVFAGGEDVLLHLREGAWEPVALPHRFSIRGLAVTPARVFVVGDEGEVHLDRGSVTCVGPETECDDGWDNDCDGLVDGADRADCGAKVKELCANLIDDDHDGLLDCKDPDCATFATCKKR